VNALAINAPHDAAVVSRPEPLLQAGEVILAVKRVGLCGTDLSTYKGTNPLVTYPRVIGHEIAAEILELGPGVASSWSVGTRVTVSPYKACGACAACAIDRPNACRNNQTLGVQREGGLAERLAVPASRLHRGEGLSLDQLAMVEPFSIGMHAVRRARVTASDTVLVLGCGGVGAGAVASASALGARVLAFDLDPRKLAQAIAFGAEDGIDGREPTAADRVRALTQGEGPSVVIEAVGHPTTYRQALDMVASCGRVCCLGWVKGDVTLEARQIVAKEVDILGSRNATDEMEAVIALFDSGRVDPTALVTDRVTMQGAPDMFARWAADPAPVGKILVSLD
jgi:threonine dehydrogenase-like Zn-dependent dehydrogenase